MRSVWIDSCCFEWNCYWSGRSDVPKVELRRAYDIWSYALRCISRQDCSDFDRADSITWLKRALNQRLKLIEKLYSLKLFSVCGSSKGYLEYLETMDIIRPYMLKNLLLIRNEIEHEDTTPPDIERCKELVDLVWYFLRSTDDLIRGLKNEFEFNDPETMDLQASYGFAIKVKFENPIFLGLEGWFPHNLVYFDERGNSEEVIVETFKTKEEAALENEMIRQAHKHRKPSDISISGAQYMDKSCRA